MTITALVFLSLARMPGHGALDTVWGEDGVVFYDGTLRNGPLSLILQPYNGYLHVVPRLVVEVVRIFPFSSAAAVMATLGALMTSCCAFLVYSASGGHLRSRALRMAIAVPAALPYVGQLEVGNNVLSIHCVLLYVAFWMCLWNPDSRSRQILAATVLFLTVASDPLTAVYIPLLILRLWTVRGWRGRLPAIAMAAGLALQGYGILFRHALQSRNVPPHYDPQWAFQNFLDNVAGQSLYTAAVGSRWGLPTASASHYVAWALTGVIVCIAALGLTNASWPLAVVAFVQSLALYAAFAMKGGTAAPRYEVPTLCLFVVTIAALANPAARRSPAEAAEPVPSDERAPHRRLAIRLAGSRSAPFLLPRLPALAVLGVVIACAKGSYSVGMHDREVAPSFSAELGRGVADCHANPTGSAVIAIAPLGLWHMDVPCALVRDRDKFFRVGVVAAGSR